MSPKNFPTKDAEAFSNFVQGRALFQSYLGSGQGDKLQQARDRFASAAARDSSFSIANFYLAVTQTELREPDAAIPILEKLVKNRQYVAEAHVQLAYAHVKRYQNADYDAATKELEKAKNAAERENRHDVLDLIEAYRVFLLAVRGGRAADTEDVKEAHLHDAIQAGEKLLERVQTQQGDASGQNMAVRFEAENALGIAFLWLGELFPRSDDSMAEWTEAEQHFRAALALRSNSVRALQNMGLLRMLEGDRSQNEPMKAREFYEEAKRFVQQSLSLNSFDQYPHFQMALLSARTKDWSGAQNFVNQGRKQKGAVSAEKWAILSQAITAEDLTKILSLR